MRKLSVCLLTAATAMAAAGAVPVTALAATGTYNIPGGKMIVIGGSMNGSNCEVPGFPGVNIPGINIPGINIPGSNIPDNSLPAPDFPIPDFPDNMLPDQPGGMLPDQPGTDGSQDAFANEVVRLVNEERAKAGLPALTVDRGAASAAQVRAKEIERSFSHTRPDGSSFNSALTEAGVNFRGAGENIAYGQNSPEKVMEGWMNSSGHRANILNSSYTSIGVGHYQNASGVNYWTQLFIR
ncbi:CAP domain-containing protein [Enterocloster aldenensis]|uniref:CAP domain-containing protein n=1 Tax=Enterocloster aldenensis TaxID=358742 RepID=UPI000E429A8B|nr:CAP domain-containing protein [Clostridiales bacterium]MBS6855672.1 CAP domain-containing protein [Clostridiales bacterium]RGC30074.1 CAP domain-containing protein [Enterocloster aldenensis]